MGSLVSGADDLVGAEQGICVVDESIGADKHVFCPVERQGFALRHIIKVLHAFIDRCTLFPLFLEAKLYTT